MGRLQGLSWKYPPPRANHASFYVDKFDMLVMHGGLGYRPDGNHHPSNATASPVACVLGDLWIAQECGTMFSARDHAAFIAQ